MVIHASEAGRRDCVANVLKVCQAQREGKPGSSKFMKHTSFSIHTQLFKLLVKRLVLNRGPTDVWLSFGLRLCCVGAD